MACLEERNTSLPKCDNMSPRAAEGLVYLLTTSVVSHDTSTNIDICLGQFQLQRGVCKKDTCATRQLLGAIKDRKKQIRLAQAMAQAVFLLSAACETGRRSRGILLSSTRYIVPARNLGEM